jgi:hypothetical protein
MTSLPSPPRRTGRLLVYKRGGCACAALPVVFCLESRRGRKGEKLSRLLGDVAIRFRHSAVTENPPPLFLSHSHSPAPPCSWKSRVLAGFRSPVLAAAVVRVVRRGFREGFCGEGFCAPSGGGFFVSLGSFFLCQDRCIPVCAYKGVVFGDGFCLPRFLVDFRAVLGMFLFVLHRTGRVFS